ncbi:MAG: 30S ribosomal protein S13 [Planctomycetes bacterium]|nr:30S ribosomal protein S13 [Planctomycetota bacterium]
MARIAGVDIPDNKMLKIGLTYIYGIGTTMASEVCQKLSLSPVKRFKELNEEEISKINSLLDSYSIEGRLKRQIQDNIQRLIRVSCYRGTRHRVGLPVRGQRTRSNARTRKGPRKTVANKKIAPAPK